MRYWQEYFRHPKGRFAIGFEWRNTDDGGAEYRAMLYSPSQPVKEITDFIHSRLWSEGKGADWTDREALKRAAEWYLEAMESEDAVSRQRLEERNKPPS